MQRGPDTLQIPTRSTIRHSGKAGPPRNARPHRLRTTHCTLHESCPCRNLPKQTPYPLRNFSCFHSPPRGWFDGQHVKSAHTMSGGLFPPGTGSTHCAIAYAYWSTWLYLQQSMCPHGRTTSSLPRRSWHTGQMSSLSTAASASLLQPGMLQASG